MHTRFDFIIRLRIRRSVGRSRRACARTRNFVTVTTHETEHSVPARARSQQPVGDVRVQTVNTTIQNATGAARKAPHVKVNDGRYWYAR